MISGRHVERIVLQNSLEKPSMLSVDKVSKFHKWLQNFIKINIKYGIFPAGDIVYGWEITIPQAQVGPWSS